MTIEKKIVRVNFEGSELPFDRWGLAEALFGGKRHDVKVVRDVSKEASEDALKNIFPIGYSTAFLEIYVKKVARIPTTEAYLIEGNYREAVCRTGLCSFEGRVFFGKTDNKLSYLDLEVRVR